jgi:hypothetical protein
MTDSKKIKTVEIIAGSLAALTAAFLGAQLGVAGTVAGAGVASLITTGGAAFYEKSLEKTAKTLKEQISSRQKTKIISSDQIRATYRHADGTTESFSGQLSPPSSSSFLQRKWKSFAVVGILSFVVGMFILTDIELVHGAPISGGNSGTTLSGLAGQSTSTAPHIDRSTEDIPSSTEIVTTYSSKETYSSTTSESSLSSSSVVISPSTVTSPTISDSSIITTTQVPSREDRTPLSSVSP